PKSAQSSGPCRVGVGAKRWRRSMISSNSAHSQDQSCAAGDDDCCELKVLTLEELLRYPFPERELILGPWLTTQSLSMIHAWRGVGKDTRCIKHRGHDRHCGIVPQLDCIKTEASLVPGW